MIAIEFSILIPHFGDITLLESCIDSIRRFPPAASFEVLVFGPAQQLESWKPPPVGFPLGLSTSTQSSGYGASANRLAEKAVGNILVIINNDINFQKPGFDAWVNGYRENSQDFILGPLLWEEDGSIQPSARRFPSPTTPFFGRRSLLRRLFANKQTRRGDLILPPAEPTSLRRSFQRQVDWINGAFLVIPANLYRQLGGFDEKFFLYWEDADLAKRATAIGAKIYYDCAYEALHKTSKATAFLPAVERTRHFHNSIIRYLAKHYFPDKSPIWVLVVRILVRLHQTLHYGKDLLQGVITRSTATRRQ